MTDDFRTRLEKELATLDAPPLGDLVGNSLHEGRRLRRRRRWYQTGAITVVGLAAAVALVGTNGTSEPTFVEPAAVTPMPSPEESRVQATPEGLLVALLQTLPVGKTSHYAGGKDGSRILAQTYLDDGSGPGMLRLVLDQEPPNTGTSSSAKIAKTKSEARFTTDEYGVASKAWKQDDGDVITVTRNPDNCIQSLVAYRQSPDGLLVQLNVAECLADNGSQNSGGRRALTEEEAVRVADDDRLGLLLPERLVNEGTERFPELPRIE